MEAEGDAVYIEANDRSEATAKLFSIMGPIPEAMLTVTEVDRLPAGEGLIH